VQCPNCRKSELDESGSCPVCDIKIQTATPVEALARSKRRRIPAGNFEGHSPERINDRAQEGDQLPQWRLDLNRRLQKIKEDREALGKTAKSGQLPFSQSEPLASRSDVPGQRPRLTRRIPRQAARQGGQQPRAESARKLPYLETSSSEQEPVAKAEVSGIDSQEAISHYPEDPGPLTALSSVVESKPEPMAKTEASGVISQGTGEPISHYPGEAAPLAAASPLSDSNPEPVAKAEASEVAPTGTEESVSHYSIDPGPSPLSDSKPEPLAEVQSSAFVLPDTEGSIPRYAVDPAALAASPSGGSKPEPVAEAEALTLASPEAESISRSNPVEIENLIDTVIEREAIQIKPSESPEKIIVPDEVRDEASAEKLILLSRTLSGMLDLIIVFLCGSAFILVTDIVSGINVVDSQSLIHYSLLLVAIFLVYSLFFLGTANQTVGMMVTNLRVVGKSGNRPAFARLLIRSAVYLLSLLGLGAGLIWGFFDRDSDCLQDKLSQTHVVRLA
jgi:uncharacterized RDD family membrane protein YckC